MNEYKIIYSPKATNDLRNIYSYIYYDLSSPENAKNQIIRIRKTIRKLNIFPNRNPVVDFKPLRGIGIHKLPIDNYVVFYIVNDKDLIINISRILYKGRNIELTLKEMLNRKS